MRKYGNEIQVTQGEDWNLDVELTMNDRDNTPYIISNQRINPYFVITVASTKFEKNLRYVKSWWNEISETPPEGGEIIPTFHSTQPIFVFKNGEFEFKDISDIETQIPATRVTFNNSYPEYAETFNTRCLYVYTLGNEEVDPNTNHKPYHYFYYDNTDRLVTEYSCHLRQNFSTDDTKEWTGQNYLYQITLVEGELLENVLTTIAKDKNGGTLPDDWPDNLTAKYNYVKVQWPNALEPDIDSDSPLGKIENPEVILSPTKLEVFNNLRSLI